MTKIEQLRDKGLQGFNTMTLKEFGELLDLVEMQHNALGGVMDMTEKQPVAKAIASYEEWNKP